VPGGMQLTHDSASPQLGLRHCFCWDTVPPSGEGSTAQTLRYQPVVCSNRRSTVSANSSGLLPPMRWQAAFVGLAIKVPRCSAAVVARCLHVAALREAGQWQSPPS